MLSKKELISMGYRKISIHKNFYAKPVGYTLFIYEGDTQIVKNWFPIPILFPDMDNV